jgi:hypothetical protein
MGRSGGHIDDAFFFTGVLALIFALSYFLYFADPLLHHDVNELWRIIEGMARPDRG